MTEPSSVETLWRATTASMRSGLWPDVARDCEHILRADPDHVGARLRLSQAVLRTGRYRDAHALVMSAAQGAARTVTDALAATKALRYFEEQGAVLALLKSSVPLVQPLDRALAACAMAVDVGAFDLAGEYLQGCATAGRRDARWLYQSGVLCTFRGEFESAERLFEACIAADSHTAQAHWMLARLERVSPKSHHLKRLRVALGAFDPGSEGATYIALALHQELHQLGRFDEAWQALAMKFGPKRWLPGMGGAASQARFDALRAWVPPDRDVAATGSFMPVFIVGMHRSGTSLLERMLAGHSQVADAGESYAFPAQLRFAADRDTAEATDLEIVRRSAAFDYASIGARYLQGSAWRASGRRVLTEKLPHNFLNVGFAAAALKEARFIHVVRDPVDTCFSNLRTFFRQIGWYTYDPLQLADFYAGYRSLMEHWSRVLPERVLSIDYAALVADPEAQIRRVLGFCGLEFEPRVLDVGRSDGVIATASSAQARGTIDANRASASAPYRAQLAPMINRLRDRGCIDPR